MIKTPVTLGTKDGGYNCNQIYDADGVSILAIYGVYAHTTFDEMERLARDNTPARIAWERAKEIVRRINEGG